MYIYICVWVGVHNLYVLTHVILLAHMCWFPVTAKTNCHELSDLKQHAVQKARSPKSLSLCLSQGVAWTRLLSEALEEDMLLECPRCW